MHIGEIRPGQLITTFGPGSIVDARNDSVMVLDLKYWENVGQIIHDARLASFLKVNYFLTPSASKKRDLPIISFPEYHVCSSVNCNYLFNIYDEFNLNEYLKKGPRCPRCSFKAYPARFVVSCDKGNHLDDFPWRWWVHKGYTDCDRPLLLKSHGKTSSLAQLVVECECGAKRSMSGATEPGEFKDYNCTGRHPFRFSYKKGGCDSKVIPLQRGASNVYFSALRSAISIPPWNDPIIDLIEEHYTRIQDYKRDFGELGVQKVYEQYFQDKYSKEEFQEALEKRETQIDTYSDIKKMEYEAITHYSKNSGNSVEKYFKAEDESVSDDLKPYIGRIIRIQRLREVLVLLGFMRNDSPEPEVDEPKGIVWLDCGSEDRWLPAVEIHGEGIFIELNKEQVKTWLKENKNIGVLSQKYKDMYNNWVEKKGWSNHSLRDAAYVMMHTLAHLLITELSLQCGYSSTAIKERIYYDGDMMGILIYTGSTDKEGSLGGLVEMGNIDRFRDVLYKALENAVFCTNDPACSTLEPQEDNHLNGSACHSCSMISETSCETGNRLLDRSLVVTLSEKNIKGYFDGLL